MSHDVLGSGPPIVLLHSGVCDRRMWTPQVGRLAQTARVIAPDLRGFGETPLLPGDFSCADDVVALLDALTVATAVLVGSSFGGRVALEVASTYSDRVSGLVLLCPAYSGLAPTAAAQSFAQQEDALLEAGALDSAVELNVTTWLGPDADDATRDLVREMQRHAFDVQIPADSWPEPPKPQPISPDLSAITAPTLVVAGGLDMDHFQAIAAYLAAEIPQAQLLSLSWAAHLPSLERPAETTTLITDFLESFAPKG
ncbi:MAG: alpha/beta hydrolase [Propionibacteriales bacterium]|nr:alpha/beta hydrolase [Propionibacteriales bacterium]